MTMKKFIYCSLALLAIMVASCTEFDEPVAEVYTAGPGVTVEVKAVADSSVTFALTIDTINTKYYAISLFKGDASAPDSMSLFKQAAGGEAKLFNAQGKDRNWDANGTLTYTYTKLDPNTTYWFYAVASSTMGMVGSVSGAKAVTTDGLSPDIKKDESDETGVSLTFSEPMKLGDGKIKLQYVASYDESLTLVDVDTANIVVEFDGATVVISADSVPAGAIVLVSWEIGAFTDMYGNPAEAFTSTIDEFDDALYYQAELESFAISEDNLTDTVGVFADYTTYKAEFKFDFPIFKRALEGPKDKYDPIEVTIWSGEYTMILDGIAAAWSVKDSSLFVSFPKEVPEGAYVSMNIPANLIVDIYGNPNDELETTTCWQRSIPKSSILGSYYWVYAVDGKTVIDTVTVMAHPTAADSLIITDVFSKGVVLEAYYDSKTNTLSVPDGQILGIYMEHPSLGTIYIVSYTSDLTDIFFRFSNDGSAIAYVDESEEGCLWWVGLSAVIGGDLTPVDEYFSTKSDIYLIPAE